jgi:hypothetical protein
MSVHNHYQCCRGYISVKCDGTVVLKDEYNYIVKQSQSEEDE